MATSFKTLNPNTDITNTRTKLHESIPLTGTIISGTYGTFPDELNIKNLELNIVFDQHISLGKHFQFSIFYFSNLTKLVLRNFEKQKLFSKVYVHLPYKTMLQMPKSNKIHYTYNKIFERYLLFRIIWHRV